MIWLVAVVVVIGVVRPADRRRDERGESRSDDAPERHDPQPEHPGEGGP